VLERADIFGVSLGGLEDDLAVRELVGERLGQGPPDLITQAACRL
jgi:hypothetical protein